MKMNEILLFKCLILLSVFVAGYIVNQIFTSSEFKFFKKYITDTSFKEKIDDFVKSLNKEKDA